MTSPQKPAAALPAELKDLLACPRCKGGLEFDDARAEIRCPACKLAFRVEDGIPVMLLDEARPIP
jgi:uncharacterized protein